jgi:putative peptidoglycan lipid II flippase
MATDTPERYEGSPISATGRDGLATDVRTAATWTLFSRCSGFIRVAVMAAVLGPTYFGNLFLITLSVPAAAQELFLGAIITILLVPALVRRIDAGEPAVAARLANGMLGVLLLLAVVLIVLLLAAGSAVLDVITMAVDDPQVRAEQQRLGWLLLVLLLPQIGLQVVISVAIAVQNAHGRFALPAAAPAVESIGIVLVLLGSGWFYGVGMETHEVAIGQVLFLALGTTAAVAAHAAVQWWGALRSGIRLLPAVAWRDPSIRQIFRLALPSGLNTLLTAGTWFTVHVAAGAVPGGVVALKIAISLFNLPIALGARPVATAQLPRLSRRALEQSGSAFAHTYRESLALARFVALPASLVFVLMPETLAYAVSFGRMASEAGITLVAVAVFGLGVGLTGEAVIVVATSACYARLDARTPLRAVALRSALTVLGIGCALSMAQGTIQLLILCLAVSIGNLTSAAYLHWRVWRGHDSVPRRIERSLLADCAAAVITVAPMAVLAFHLPNWISTQELRILAAVALLSSAGALYLLLQWRRGAPAMMALLARPAGPPGREQAC